VGKKKSKTSAKAGRPVARRPSASSPSPPDPHLLIYLKSVALVWARECGMAGEIVIGDPVAITGGWDITAMEVDGQKRMALARLSSAGVPTLWEMWG
jgi:hypothetical protein